jgi:lipopolysaccharide biosynthesis glycosyltransferase
MFMKNTVRRIFYALLIFFVSLSSNATISDNRQRIPIFFVSDDKYAAYTATAMTSILHNTDSFIEFYIVSNKINKLNKRRIESPKNKFNNFSIEFISVDENKIFEGFRIVNNRFPLEVYLKLLTSTLKPDVDRLIYLDSDIVVLDDIAKLYNEDISGYMLGAVIDKPILKLQNTNFHKRGLTFTKEYKYFNSGVLLIDAKKWRENNVQRKLFEIEKEYREYLVFPDQDILNKFFSEAGYKILDSRYNDLEYCDNTKNIVIKHNVGNQKPLKADNYILAEGKKLSNCFEYFWLFAEKTPFYNTLLRRFSIDFMSKGAFSTAKFRDKVLGYVKTTEKNQAERNYADAVIVISFLLSLMIFLSTKNLLKQRRKNGK